MSAFQNDATLESKLDTPESKPDNQHSELDNLESKLNALKLESKLDSLESKLKSLECHFTWDLDSSKAQLYPLSEKLMDIHLEGNVWAGPIYNLQGFIHQQLGLITEAQRFFTDAAGMCAEQDPWMVVTYGNLAWLHHHQGNNEESLRCLEKVDSVLKKKPLPTQDELLPEICAEKAWTLMNFNQDKLQLADEYFKRAIKMQPDRIEWKTSRVLGLAYLNYHETTKLGADLLKEIRFASEEDPENLFLAAVLLDQRMKNGEHMEEEVEELTRRIMQNPISSYSGFKPLLNLYQQNQSVDKAIRLAEEALSRFPDERYLKKCVARCYKRKIIFYRQGRLDEHLIHRAIDLYKDLIRLYPHTMKMKLHLALIYSESADTQNQADQLYHELMENNLEPLDKQMVYCYYAKYLFFTNYDIHGSAQFYMKAAAIPGNSHYRENSIKKLELIVIKVGGPLRREVQEFLENLRSTDCQHGDTRGTFKLEKIQNSFTPASQ